MSPTVTQSIYDGTTEYGWEAPTAIQISSIPIILKEQNLIAQAPSGSGKTLAFLCGALTLCNKNLKKPQVLVLANTRELTIQNYDVFKVLNKNDEFECGCSLPTDPKNPNDPFAPPVTKKTNQFIFGTLGTMLYEIKNKKWSIDAVKLIVIDEADEIIIRNMKDVAFFFGPKIGLPKEVKIAIFSATYPPKAIKDFINLFKDSEDGKHKSYLKKEFVDNSFKGQRDLQNVKEIHHYFLKVHNTLPKHNDSLQKLVTIFKTVKTNQVIIFANSKNTINEIVEFFKQSFDGETYKCAGLMAGKDVSVSERDRIVRDFRDRKIKILVTTNLLARGFDDPDIYLVINFEGLPRIQAAELPEPKALKPNYKFRNLFTLGNIALLQKNPKSKDLFNDPNFEGLLKSLSQKKIIEGSDLSNPKIYEAYKFIHERPGVAKDTYVHRAGRAGRAGRQGICLTFISNKYEENQLELIKKEVGIQLDEITQDEFNKPETLKQKLDEPEDFGKPIEETQVENAPVENPPVENAPVENTPVENPPVETKKE